MILFYFSQFSFAVNEMKISILVQFGNSKNFVKKKKKDRNIIFIESSTEERKEKYLGSELRGRVIEKILDRKEWSVSR